MAEPLNLALLAERTEERLGDHDAMVFEGQTLRSAELARRGRAAAGGLADIGVAPGERVVVLMANCPEVYITYNAIWRAGAVVTPVVFLVTADELRHILIDSGAAAVVTTGELLHTVMDAAAGTTSVRDVIVAGPFPAVTAEGDVPTLRSFADLETAAERPIVERDDRDLAALMYTGGTTGRAKGVALSHANLWSGAKSLWDTTYVAGLTRTLVPLPLSHAYGMIVTIVGMHAVEPGLAIVQRWFNPSEWVSLAEQWRAERTALVPAMVQMLLAEPLEDADLSSMRYVGCGAAPLSMDVLGAFERRVPSAQILEGYGCTETSAVISANPPGRRRLGSVGVPIAGCAVQIAGDDEAALAVDCDGEICVRSPFVMAGYWNAAEESAAVLRDGWLHTGDIGHLDPDGYLYVVDRKKDLILRGGFNVFPRDVEDVMLAHPDVAMAGVVGRPDDRLGEEVVAFVSLRPGATVGSEQLVEFARSRLAATKYPREVRVVDSVPLTSVGKLDRKALRQQAAMPR